MLERELWATVWSLVRCSFWEGDEKISLSGIPVALGAPAAASCIRQTSTLRGWCAALTKPAQSERPATPRPRPGGLGLRAESARRILTAEQKAIGECLSVSARQRIEPMPDRALDPVEWEIVRADIAMEKARLKANGGWAKWEEFQSQTNIRWARMRLLSTGEAQSIAHPAKTIATNLALVPQ